MEAGYLNQTWGFALCTMPWPTLIGVTVEMCTHASLHAIKLSERRNSREEESCQAKRANTQIYFAATNVRDVLRLKSYNGLAHKKVSILVLPQSGNK